MSVRDFLMRTNRIKAPGAHACICPFHNDTAPSAMINDDTSSIYCFRCQRSYFPQHFLQAFGVVITSTGIINKPIPEYEWGHPLFYV
jgi:hypothetical protein